MHKIRLVVAMTIVVCAVSAQARSMRWRSFDVHALLDDRGVLRVTEKQTVVFDGDWNGGERTFVVHPGQTLEFHSISRLEDGREIPLEGGSLEQTDRWNMPAPNVVRWRSRMPSDPPFQNRELVYVLSYSLWGALADKGDRKYDLSHNFTFETRAGPIDEASVELRLDPVWKGVESPIVRTMKPLPDGENLIINQSLEFTGRTAPFILQPPAPQPIAVRQVHAAAEPIEPPVQRPLILLVTLGSLVLLILFWVIQERATGRFEPLPTVDEAWIREHILPMKAELLAAAYHQSPGEAEVSVVLARMAAEKKLTITPDVQGGLRLRLEVDRASLPHYERTLVDGLFFGGQSQVESWAVKAHYAESGFTPAWLIRGPLLGELNALGSWSGKRSGTGWWLFAAFALGLVGFVLAVNGFASDDTATFVWVLLGGVFSAVPAIYALTNTRGVANLWGDLTTVLFFNGFWYLALVALSMTTLGVYRASLAPTLGCALCTFASTLFLLAVLRSRDLPEKIAFRRRLAAARVFFASELTTERPRHQEAWLPYFLAFDLGSDVDRWRRTYNAAEQWSFVAGVASLARGVSRQVPTQAFASSNDDTVWDHDRSSSWSRSSSSSSDSSSSSSSSSSSHSGGGSGGGW